MTALGADPQWKELSYKNGEPNSWWLNLGRIKITLVRGNLYYPENWVFHCYPLGMDTVNTKLPIEQPVSVAQARAISRVADFINDLADEIGLTF